MGDCCLMDIEFQFCKMKKFWRFLYNINIINTAAKLLQLCPTLCDPEMAAHQAPPSLGFSRQEHWSGLPFPSPMHESEK